MDPSDTKRASPEPFVELSSVSLCDLQVGQEIEVRPGIVSKDQEGKLMCKPIFSKIVSLFAEHNDLQYAAPGGLIGQSTLTHFNLSNNNLGKKHKQYEVI